MHVPVSPLLSQSASVNSSVIQRKAGCACGGGCPSCEEQASPSLIRTKLQVSTPGDQYEHEADRVADRVMRMPDPGLQRQCKGCSDESARIPSDAGELQIQRQANGKDNAGEVSSDFTSRLGAGARLDTASRGYFEPRFGHDFGNVRIHTGPQAAAAAHSIRARAFTLGHDVVFAAGEHDPGSEAGKRLLAHELTHVVQQQTGTQRKKLQKMDDATFEANTGVDKGIKKGTMTKDAAINGKTFTVSCGFNSYDFSFKFAKAYKGDYPYTSAGKDVRGIYVKIEASIKDKEKCGRCTPMQLIQVTRDSAKNAAGVLESVKPTSATREARGGWSDPKAPSRGWYVDTLDSAKSAFVTDLAHTAEAGDETKPAILWDPPGYWSTDTNKGGDFYTCAVCQDASKRKWIAACVQWGSYTDGSGNINFNPLTPVASCGSIQTVRDASERWDAIPGNTKTGITF